MTARRRAYRQPPPAPDGSPACPRCGQSLPQNERHAYGGVCEDCRHATWLPFNGGRRRCWIVVTTPTPQRSKRQQEKMRTIAFEAVYESENREQAD